MKLEAHDHPKTLALASLLAVEIPTAIGYLELLFAFVAKRTPQGNVGKWADGVIASACFWRGEPAAFVNALRESGYLDADPEHRLLVHDWPQHCPNWVRAKLKKDGLEFILSGALKVPLKTDEKTQSSPSNETPIEPSSEASSRADLNQGQPSLSKPSVTGAAAQPDVPRLAKLQKPEEPDCMVEFRSRYPKRSGTQRWDDARTNIIKLLGDGYTAEEILAGVDRYARWCQAEGIVGRREVMQAGTFVGKNKSFLESYDIPPPKLNGHQSTERQRAAETEARNWEGWKQRASRCNCRAPHDGESLPAYIAEVERHEQSRRSSGPKPAASALPQLARPQ